MSEKTADTLALGAPVRTSSRLTREPSTAWSESITILLPAPAFARKYVEARSRLYVRALYDRYILNVQLFEHVLPHNFI